LRSSKPSGVVLRSTLMHRRLPDDEVIAAAVDLTLQTARPR
jgi:hypothetical protein